MSEFSQIPRSHFGSSLRLAAGLSKMRDPFGSGLVCDRARIAPPPAMSSPRGAFSGSGQCSLVQWIQDRNDTVDAIMARGGFMRSYPDGQPHVKQHRCEELASPQENAEDGKNAEDDEDEQDEENDVGQLAQREDEGRDHGAQRRETVERAQRPQRADGAKDRHIEHAGNELQHAHQHHEEVQAGDWI